MKYGETLVETPSSSAAAAAAAGQDSRLVTAASEVKPPKSEKPPKLVNLVPRNPIEVRDPSPTVVPSGESEDLCDEPGEVTEEQDPLSLGETNDNAEYEQGEDFDANENGDNLEGHGESDDVVENDEVESVTTPWHGNEDDSNSGLDQQDKTNCSVGLEGSFVGHDNDTAGKMMTGVDNLEGSPNEDEIAEGEEQDDHEHDEKYDENNHPEAFESNSEADALEIDLEAHIANLEKSVESSAEDEDGDEEFGHVQEKDGEDDVVGSGPSPPPPSQAPTSESPQRCRRSSDEKSEVSEN